jgi:DNA-binding transcriptional MerR regulator
MDTESCHSYNHRMAAATGLPGGDPLTVEPLTVDRVAAISGLGVDTIRYYQRLGLLEAPARQGRRALYSQAHLERLAEIRHLADEGFSLSQIATLDTSSRSGALGRLADATSSSRLTRHEVADLACVPEGLVSLLTDNGILEPITVDGETLFDESAVPMVRAGLAISAAGVPLDELVALAADHSANVDQVVDRAIALFEDHITVGTDGSDDALVDVVRSLLPAVTRLVAQHFNRTLVNRALDRVADSDRRTLADALAAADADRLEVICRWP